MVFLTAMFLSALTIGQTENETDPALELQVRRLVKELDADELGTRQAAEASLIELGPRALDLLPPVRRNTSAEVKVRLERIRSALENAMAEAASSPSTVTLSGKMLLSAALAQVEKQTGNKFVDFRARFGQQRPDTSIEVDLEDAPFWKAVDQILDQANLTVYNFGGEAGAISLVAREEGAVDRSEGASYAGIFRFQGVRVQATRDLRSPANTSLRCTFEVSWEPRLTPIVLQFPLDQMTIEAESGTALALANAGRSNYSVGPQNNVPASELVIPLALPTRDTKKIASLRGKMTAMVPGRIETFEFGDLESAKRVETTIAGATVVLDQVRKNQELFQVLMRVRFDDAANALESHRGWVYNNPAYILDADGARIENIGSELTGQQANEIGTAYLFDLEDGLKGCKFVYQTPAKIVQMPVDFELKDIPLP